MDSLTNLRVGSGIDVHRISPERPLILGGVKIQDTYGLEGHSDADVLTHALMDALLGAAGLPDIGFFFPPTEMKWKDAFSIDLLKQVGTLLQQKSYKILNADCSLILESPKIAPFREAMKENIATALSISTHQIGIKATTAEALGAIGRREGAYAFATVLLLGAS